MERVLVTGSSRGLGRALVMELNARGFKVVATARNLADLDGVKAEKKLALDVTKPESVAAAVREAGVVDVLINNAGIAVEGPVEAIPLEVVQSVFDTNVFGPLRMIQAFLPGMRERGYGLIINISSLAGRFSPPLEGIYSASKAALEMLSEELRFEAGHFDVDVVLVESGGIRTGMNEQQPQYTHPAYADLLKGLDERMAEYSRKRGGSSPEEIASAVVDVIGEPDPPLRVEVGVFFEKVLGHLGGQIAGPLSRLGLKW